jgi:hypothetical protein
MKNFNWGDVSGLNMTATRARPGAASLSRSSHLPAIDASWLMKPVRLPPGCLMLATKPCATGSETDTKTTGTVLVASRITVRLIVVEARITSGISPINSELTRPDASRNRWLDIFRAACPAGGRPRMNQRNFCEFLAEVSIQAAIHTNG